MQQSFKEAVTNDVTCPMQSIRRAHANIKPGRLRVNSGELLEANANRSPQSYLNNPEEERARYKHNTDKVMTQLSATDTEGKGDTSAPHWKNPTSPSKIKAHQACLFLGSLASLKSSEEFQSGLFSDLTPAHCLQSQLLSTHCWVSLYHCLSELPILAHTVTCFFVHHCLLNNSNHLISKDTTGVAYRHILAGVWHWCFCALLLCTALPLTTDTLAHSSSQCVLFSLDVALHSRVSDLLQAVLCHLHFS